MRRVPFTSRRRSGYPLAHRLHPPRTWTFRGERLATVGATLGAIPRGPRPSGPSMLQASQSMYGAETPEPALYIKSRSHNKSGFRKESQAGYVEPPSPRLWRGESVCSTSVLWIEAPDCGREVIGKSSPTGFVVSVETQRASREGGVLGLVWTSYVAESSRNICTCSRPAVSSARANRACGPAMLYP